MSESVERVKLPLGAVQVLAQALRNAQKEGVLIAAIRCYVPDAEFRTSEILGAERELWRVQVNPQPIRYAERGHDQSEKQPHERHDPDSHE